MPERTKQYRIKSCNCNNDKFINFTEKNNDMICFPNCKINLGLYIENKRNDGFHNIKTVFYPVALSDVLEISLSNTTTHLNMRGIKIEGNIESNLCIKAYRLLSKDYNLPPIQIELLKAIPHGAGLGGGSSDAAYMLKLLNNFFNLNINDLQLINYASQLGSDCAFFIKNKAVIASEKGDFFKEIELILRNYSIIIVKPPINVSTPDAYKWVKPRNEIIDIEYIIMHSINEWKDLLTNDFEFSVFKKYPEIEHIKTKLYENGALYSAMSGSGASVFGIFKDEIPDISFEKNYFIWKSKIY